MNTWSLIALAVALVALVVTLYFRHKHRAVCIWCGTSFDCHDASEKDEVLERIQAHHERCGRNPVVLRCQALAEELQRCREEGKNYRW